MVVDVLIVTNRLDLPTDRLCDRLSSLGKSFLRCNREDMSSFAFEMDPLEPSLRCRFQETEWTIDGSLKSVWWRQPTFRRIAPEQLPTPAEQLEESQWSAFMRGLSVFNHARWFNSPAATYQAESKLFQLRIAAEIGFDIPITRVTNDPNAEIDLTVGSQIALKSIDTVYLTSGSFQQFGYTQLVDWDTCADANFHLVPAMCQAVVQDKIDLRVTVAGDQIWCDAVLNSGHGIDGDWRLIKRDRLEYRTFDLPDQIVKQIQLLMTSLNLNFGAIDLALAQDKFWFIEINPTGEWGWLDRAGRGIAEGIAHELGH